MRADEYSVNKQTSYGAADVAHLLCLEQALADDRAQLQASLQRIRQGAIVSKGGRHD